ncbi:MAG: hypothetical protein R3C03_19865 [Pirellulaceae bacterium]
MNLMGKILTGFIFVMSLAFLFLAVMVGQTHRNWKQIATTNKQKAEVAQRALQNSLSNATEMKTQLKNEKVARQQQLQQLFSQLAIEKRTREEKETQLTEQIVISRKQFEELDTTEKRLAVLDSEIKQLKESNKQMVDELATKRTQVVALTNTLNKQQADLEILENRAQDLSSELASVDKVMRLNGLDKNSPLAGIPPKVEAVIVKVQDDLVVVSVGTDDGLLKGHSFDIYRGKRFIGKAVVSETNHNMAVLRVVPEFLQAAVLEGDHVTTKL